MSRTGGYGVERGGDSLNYLAARVVRLDQELVASSEGSAKRRHLRQMWNTTELWVAEEVGRGTFGRVAFEQSIERKKLMIGVNN